MRLVFAGTPPVALPSLEALRASGHELVAVLTRPDAPAGRGRVLLRSPVAAWADDHGLEVLAPRRPSEPEFQQRLRDIAPQCVPVVAYGALVPPAALRIPANGWINLHFSLLPAWRGAAPVQHALLHGDEITGASVFQLEAGMDTGPVYGTLTEAIRATDTAGDLLDRLAHSGAALLVEVLNGIEAGTVAAQPQPTDGVSLAPKITVEDAAIRWDDPAFAVDRRIRACTPAPGAWTMLRGERVKVGPVRLADSGAAPDPAGAIDAGEIRLAGRVVLVGTGTAPVRLGNVQPAGKASMPADAWLRGLRPGARERFHTPGIASAAEPRGSERVS
jgi:methionyl-tRNA formyltransferase